MPLLIFDPPQIPFVLSTPCHRAKHIMDRNFISLTVAQLWFCVFMCPFNFGYVVLSEVNCVRSTGGTIYYYLFIYLLLRLIWFRHLKYASYVYWTVHHLDSWIKRDQLDITCFLFHYLLLNMFRMLVHPSSGTCDLFDELFHGLYCSGSMRVGITLWFG